jgi:hypothetical protein
MFLRDELIDWKIPPEIDDEVEWKKKLRSTVDPGVATILERIKNLAPPIQTSDKVSVLETYIYWNRMSVLLLSTAR